MKSIITSLLLLAASLIFLCCSSDHEILDPDIVNSNSQEKDLPMESLAEIGAFELPGFPKSIKKYQNGNLHFWAQYYYRFDGNLLKINYSYPKSGTEIFTDTYFYNTEGKLTKLNGHDVYNFYWDNNRIVEADRYNAMWLGRSKIFYEYNSEGQIIQKTENNIDFFEREKTIYSYFGDGNLKTIKQYGDYSESGVFKLYFETNFEGYKGDKNRFLEVEIVPGQIVQHHFPSSMNFKHLTETGYDKYETYEYKYDPDGRVIEKIYGSDKVIYEYY